MEWILPHRFLGFSDNLLYYHHRIYKINISSQCCLCHNIELYRLWWFLRYTRTCSGHCKRIIRAFFHFLRTAVISNPLQDRVPFIPSLTSFLQRKRHVPSHSIAFYWLLLTMPKLSKVSSQLFLLCASRSQLSQFLHMIKILDIKKNSSERLVVDVIGP